MMRTKVSQRQVLDLEARHKRRTDRYESNRSEVQSSHWLTFCRWYGRKGTAKFFNLLSACVEERS